MAKKKVNKTNIAMGAPVRWQHSKTGEWQYGIVRKTYNNSALIEIGGIEDGDYTVISFKRLELIDKTEIIVESTKEPHPYVQQFPHNADKREYNERRRKAARKA
ncbi:hypothetical protein A0U40_09725 [[Bacillus] sp. KCTC 13219]|nr:hypothetical protein A0U40_09725 [[Bacillus] sp. KCTC 13219]